METELSATIKAQAQRAKQASQAMRQLSTAIKNRALLAMADALQARVTEIVEANAQDLAEFDAYRSGANRALRNRFVLNAEKVAGIAEGVRAVAALADPVGEIISMTRRPNGLRVGKIRIPIGVICAIYESRPNVTVDIAALCLKSGNACVLRGGKESLRTNRALAEILRAAAAGAGVPEDYLQMVAVTDHGAVAELAKLSEYIDLIIPRGGEALIDAVCANAKMPVMRHRKGVTHLYIDGQANQDMAVRVAVNAKISNPSACNSLEKVLVDTAIAPQLMPMLVSALRRAGVEVRGCEKTRAIIADVVAAKESDWSEEYLDLIIAIKVIDGIDAAITHIQTYSTGLADGIVTEDYSKAWKFLNAIDSAATFVNASTRFTDGGEFGLGAEIGINTSKIHGMGPMGLQELTVTKYIVFGQGQIRE